MTRRTPWPRSIVWEVTARCNLRCGHCYNYWTAPGQALPADLGTREALRVLERLQAGGRAIRTLTFTGGEPLLRPDLGTLVAGARRLLPGVELNLATNGLLLTPPLAVELRRSGLGTVQLSLLSARPALHERMTGGPGTFARTLEAIACAKGAGLGVAVFFVATRENIADLPGTARLAAALGADTVVFNRFQPGGRGLANWRRLTPAPEQLARALEQFAGLRPSINLGMGTLVPPCEVGLHLEPRRPRLCPIGTANAYPTIGPDGRLRPCNHTPVAAGSLLASPLGDLLESACLARPAFGGLPPRCADCRFIRYCQGGCPAAQALAGECIYSAGEG